MDRDWPRPWSSSSPRHYEHALVIVDMDPDADPPKVLVIGPRHDGQLLEVIILTLADERQLVIHAIPLRPTFHDLLPEGDL